MPIDTSKNRHCIKLGIVPILRLKAQLQTTISLKLLQGLRQFSMQNINTKLPNTND